MTKSQGKPQVSKASLPTVTIGGVVYYCPFHDAVRKHTDAEREALKASGIACGGFVEPILTYDSEALGAPAFIDGHTRWELAAEADIPVQHTHLEGVSDELAELMSRGLNAARRHLSLKDQVEARQERVGRIAAMRRLGKSLRAIAAEEGVSEKQVRRDLEEATAAGDAVEPEKIEGLNGKTYSVPEMLKDLRKLVPTNPTPSPTVTDAPDPNYKPEPFTLTHPHADLLSRLDGLVSAVTSACHECPPLARAFGRTSPAWLLRSLRSIILSTSEAA